MPEEGFSSKGAFDKWWESWQADCAAHWEEAHHGMGREGQLPSSI